MAITLNGSSSGAESIKVAHDGPNAFVLTNASSSAYVGLASASGHYANSSEAQDIVIRSNNGVVLSGNDGARTDLRVDSAGRVTMPYQPGFRSGTWTFDSNGYGLNYASASGNSGGMSFNYRNSGHFNTTTGRFTAPVSGKYLIQATYADDNAVESRSIGHLFINGSGRGEWVESWGQYDNTSNCIIEYLNAGDYVQFGRHPGIPYSGLVASIDVLG